MRKRQTASLIVMDRKGETAAIAVPGRGRRRREGVKIINPFGMLTEPGAGSTGCDPLGDPGMREGLRTSENKD
jgi:hypothetical protein